MFVEVLLVLVSYVTKASLGQVVGSQMVQATIPVVHDPPSPQHFAREGRGQGHDGHDHGSPGGGRSLMCNCTFPTSQHCSFDGLCDAHHVALHLRNDARTTAWAIEELRKDPEHRKSSEWSRSLCQKLTGGVVEDLLLLEYEAWEPACQRLSPSQLRCGMGPRLVGRGSRVGADGYAALSKASVDAKRRDLADLLRCNATVGEVQGHVYVCQGQDYCNSVEPTVSAAELRDAAMPLWFYVVVPVGALLFLLTLVAVACAAYRGHLWNAVMKVSDPSHHHKYYEDVDIADIMPEFLPAKDIRPDTHATTDRHSTPAPV